MSKQKFVIVAREKDFKPFSQVPGRDKWGWEVIDNVENEYDNAKKLMSEYVLAMPLHVIRLRPVNDCQDGTTINN